MRHTKIIATIGPASRTDEIIEQLIGAGVDVCRLNFSHGTHEAHAETFQRIRAAAARATKVVSILQDLGGPKIRTGRLKDGRAIVLKDGQTIRIVAGDGEGDEEHIYTTYGELVRKTRPGGMLLLDDGKIQLEIERADGREIVARVVEGGALEEHKGINAPGVQLSADALTPKDIEDLKFGARLGVDMVALSFVRSADDMWQARQILTEIGAPNIPLIAKIERPEALDHLEEILKVSQGVMVARGDLGLEMPLERVPTSQKEITRKARRSGIPVIVATQVLESMRLEPRPTRAEVSDAANADICVDRDRSDRAPVDAVSRRDADDDGHRERCGHDGDPIEAGTQHKGSRAERLGGGVHQRERPARARRSEFSEFAEIRISRPASRPT